MKPVRLSLFGWLLVMAIAIPFSFLTAVLAVWSMPGYRP
jgi:hypothetical protein